MPIVKLKCSRHGVSDIPEKIVSDGTEAAFVQAHFTEYSHKPGDTLFTYQRISMYLDRNPVRSRFHVTKDGHLVNESILALGTELINELSSRLRKS